MIAPAAIACLCQGAGVRHSDHVLNAAREGSQMGALVLVTVSWLLIVSAALLVLRAVISEPLGSEQDESDDEVSGHVRGRSGPGEGIAPGR